MSPRIAALVLLCAASACASAQTVHKCTVDGKVTYTELPCQGGQASVIAVPDAPAQDKSNSADLQRLRKQADTLELARHKKEDADERADAATSKVVAKRHQACEKLKLEKKWADEDLRRAQPQHEERARIKAQRAGERLKLSCGS